MTGDHRSPEDLEARTEEIMRLLQRHRVLTTFAGRRGPPGATTRTMQRRENLAELQRMFAAFTRPIWRASLSSLPRRDRLTSGGSCRAARGRACPGRGRVGSPRSIHEAIDRPEMDEAIAELDADDLAYCRWLPPGRWRRRSPSARDRTWIATLAGPEDSVGRLMTRDVVDP